VVKFLVTRIAFKKVVTLNLDVVVIVVVEEDKSVLLDAFKVALNIVENVLELDVDEKLVEEDCVVDEDKLLDEEDGR
jgi:hypothetical protein